MGFVPPARSDQQRAIKKAGDWEFDFVELIVEPIFIRNGFDRTSGELATIESLLDTAGLDLMVHLPHRLDIATPLDQVRKETITHLQNFIELAGTMGAEKGIIHADSPTTYAGTSPDILHGSIRELYEFATGHEFELCVENIPNEYFAEYGFERLFKETPASITLDTGHAHLSGLGPDEMATLISTHHDRLSHITSTTHADRVMSISPSPPVLSHSTRF